MRYLRIDIILFELTQNLTRFSDDFSFDISDDDIADILEEIYENDIT
jgi:hypothetical protein